MSGTYIPDRDINGNIVQPMAPFTSKNIAAGKLFRRLHGVTATLTASGDTVVEYTIPYTKCKITGMQLAWCPEGVTADLEIFDTESGTISGTPNAKINQFGFTAPIQKDFHMDESSYDADLIAGLKIKVTLHNSSIITKTVGIGFILHEVV